MSIWLMPVCWLRSSWRRCSGCLIAKLVLEYWRAFTMMTLSGGVMPMGSCLRSWWRLLCRRCARCLVGEIDDYYTGVLVGGFSITAIFVVMAVVVEAQEKVDQAEVAAELASGRCICVDGLERLVELVDG